MKKLKLVIRMIDGTRRKGLADNFNPSKSFLLLKEIDPQGKLVAYHDIDMERVLAVFFVNDLAMTRTARHTNRDAPNEMPVPDVPGTKMRLKFVWGEVMDVIAVDYDPQVWGFYFYPMGPLNRSYNIEKAFVTKQAVVEAIKLDPESEAAKTTEK